MSAHTPGPWQAKTRNIYGGGGRIVAQAHWPVVPGRVTSEEPSAEELAANIALLAAAPDLLESLAGALRSSDGQDCPYCGSRFGGPKECTECAWFGEARAAIAKARGAR